MAQEQLPRNFKGVEIEPNNFERDDAIKSRASRKQEKRRDGLTAAKVGFRDKKNKSLSAAITTANILYDQAKISADECMRASIKITCFCRKSASQGGGQLDCSCAFASGSTTQTDSAATRLWVKQSIIVAKCAREEEYTRFAEKKIPCRIIDSKNIRNIEWLPSSKSNQVKITNSTTTGMRYWLLEGIEHGRNCYMFGYEDDNKLKYATVVGNKIIFKDEYNNKPFPSTPEIDDPSTPTDPRLFMFKSDKATNDPDAYILYPPKREDFTVTYDNTYVKLEKNKSPRTAWKIEKDTPVDPL